MTHESTEAWHELLDTLRDLDQAFLDGDRAVHGRPPRRRRLPGAGHDPRGRPRHLPVRRAEPAGLRRAQHAVPPRPALGRRQHRRVLPATPVDPSRRYRITGNRGDASTSRSPSTTSRPPAPGRTRSCCTSTTATSTSTPTATSPSSIGPVPDIAALRDPRLPGRPACTGRPVRWEIEALDEPDPIRHGDAETAAALRASAAWLRTMFVIIPLTVGVRVEDEHTLGHEIANAANTIGAPYQVPDSNFGWSARDACYSFGSYDLAEDEALVVTHRPPRLPVLEHGRLEPVHGQPQRRRRPDLGQHRHRRAQRRRHRHGGDRHGPSAHPNALTTLDYPRGNLAFRWFLARRGAGAARGLAGEARGRPDRARLRRQTMSAR